MKKIKLKEAELVNLIEKLVKENLGAGNGQNFGIMNTPTAKYKEMFERENIEEDSEGEETYNYGEDEGHDKKEEMSMEDHVKAIEDHLSYLKKDMGYDEDREDRDEKGTDFMESRKPKKRMAESRKVKRSRRR